jgi:acetyltransferase
MSVIRQVSAAETSLIGELAPLLIDSVAHGASVGFLASLSLPAAAAWWQDIFAELDHGRALFIATQQERIVGTVQLALCLKDNGRHRAELQKLMVLSSCQGQGIASQLMHAAETYARGQKRSLLVLDTAGARAEAVYRHLGWQRAGEIPGFAADPDGTLKATVLYYKQLETHGQPTDDGEPA